MKYAPCVLLTALLTLTQQLAADEAAMNQTLDAWEGRLDEYRAALERAETPEAKAAVEPPSAADLSPTIWKSISGTTGSRQLQIKGKDGQELRTVHSYEFQQAWAAPAVNWLLAHPDEFAAALGSGKQASAYARAVRESLADIHYSHPSAAELCPILAAGTSVDEYGILEKIYTRNCDTNARACAALGMSLMLNNPMITGAAGSEAMARGKRLYYLKQALLLAKPDTRFGDSPLFDIANEQTYRLRRLSVGCVPPQLKLRDAQGQEVTLPEAGKHTLLFFWSPQEALGSSLVSKLAALPQRYPELNIVAIAPAAADEAALAALQQTAGSTPCYTDDADGTAGRDYRISILPTAVLLAPNSTILYSGYPDIRLQSALENAFPTRSEDNTKGRIEITPAAQEQAPQGETPTPADEEPPALRDMPEF